MDRDAWEERAAIREFDGGQSRFEAETKAAQEQGKSRWEAISDVAKRVVSTSRDQREALAQRAGQDDLPEVQRGAAKEDRPVPVRQRG